MNKKLKFYIVDDDYDLIKFEKVVLESIGYEVLANFSSTEAYDDIINCKPDVIIIDIMMPGIDGLELCQKLQESEELKHSKIIIVSAKAYEFDKERAFSFGADGYIVKPFDAQSFIKQVEEVINQKLIITFWGIRGTLPVPGKKTIKYGGNTSCVTVSFPLDKLFIFDAGSGVKELSNYLFSIKKTRFKAKFFISHPHWDHINAIPFFVPFYIQGNEFEICGASHGNVKMQHVISDQMSGIYFPITIREFGSSVYFKDLTEGGYMIDGISVKTKLLVHPGYDLGYKIDYQGKSICYITDNELYPPESKSYSKKHRDGLIDFIRNADILIHECTYFDEEYSKKVDWGHSSVSQVAELAHSANAKNLYIFHHDPDHTDNDVDRKVDTINKILNKKHSSTKCFAAVEQEKIIVPI